MAAAVGLTACGPTAPAPVVDAWKQKSASRYRVQRGDTLYSVAFAFGFDYRDIARVNHLSSPYAIKPGEWLVMKKEPKQVGKKSRRLDRNPTKIRKAKPIERAKKYYFAEAKKPVLHNPVRWRWPVKSKLLQRFTGSYGRSQGIDLAGWKGRNIYAAAPGLVVYSGAGVRGYGNLVIIKHSEEYLSAYAYASKRFVHVGQRVKAGQRIAAMGQDNYGRVRLHFELRRKGRPVNPLRYLR
jgi:lipoprotein NlpD